MEQFRKGKKAPKGQESPGAYRMGTFWKIHFIYPPEVEMNDAYLPKVAPVVHRIFPLNFIPRSSFLELLIGPLIFVASLVMAFTPFF